MIRLTVSSVVVIYNPAAGQGRAGERLAEVEGLLERHGVSYSLELTGYPGHAIDLAREAALRDGTDTIVAAGGDGTANEVLNGLMQAQGTGASIPAMGVLCVGRGNDFAFGAGIPTDLEDGVRALADGVASPIDVGYLRGGRFPDGRYFGNGIGIGFDTIVGFEAAKMTRIKGFAAYVFGALKALAFYYRAPTLTLTTDGGEETRPCIQVSVMNGRRMGGAFLMAPKATMTDGLFDLCIAGTPSRPAMLGLIVKYLKGTQEGHPHIVTGRTRRFRVVSAGEPIAIHADGETVSTDGTELDVECVASAITVRRPALAAAVAAPSPA